MQLRVAAPAEVTRYAYVTFDALLILILLAGAVALAGAIRRQAGMPDTSNTVEGT